MHGATITINNNLKLIKKLSTLKCGLFIYATAAHVVLLATIFTSQTSMEPKSACTQTIFKKYFFSDRRFKPSSQNELLNIEMVWQTEKSSETNKFFYFRSTKDFNLKEVEALERRCIYEIGLKYMFRTA